MGATVRTVGSPADELKVLVEPTLGLDIDVERRDVSPHEAEQTREATPGWQPRYAGASTG
jgi:hypothetical protein